MESITENNKLIAKYMQSSKNVNYQEDWNELIKVGEKIKNDGYKICMHFLDNQGYIVKYSDIDSISNQVADVGSIPNKYVSNPPTAEFPMFIHEFNCPKEAMYNLFLRFIKKLS
jgi:hypothetical protein